MSKRKPRDKRLSIARSMPPLRKKLPGQIYQPKNDEVLKWLGGRPDLLAYLFDKVHQAGYVVYDEDSGCWKGVDCDDEN